MAKTKQQLSLETFSRWYKNKMLLEKVLKGFRAKKT